MPLTRFLALALVTTAPLAAQNGIVKLTHPGNPSFARLGASVALTGTRVIVADPLDSDLGGSAGSAHIYDAITGQHLFELHASDGTQGDLFGYSVGADGDRAVVGTERSDAVYVFDLTTGQELQLTSPDWVQGNYVASAVDISGDVAIVGVPHDDELGHVVGAAYLFDVTTGQQLFKLLPSDAPAQGQFGISVAIDGDRAVVGAWWDDASGSEAGSVYVFDATTGQELFKLLASDGAPGAHFGRRVAIDGDLAVVGADRADEPGVPDTGRAYVFDVTTGAQLHVLRASDRAAGDRLGSSVAVAGDRAMIGAWWDDDQGSRSGSVYLVDTTSGRELFKYTAPDGTANARLGTSVAMTTLRAVSGAQEDDGRGAAYVFPALAPIGSQYCTPAVPNSTGQPARIEAQGNLDAASNVLRLVATQLPTEQFGYFLASETQGFVQGPGGSQGDLCLGGQIARFRNQVQSSGFTGELAIQVNLGAIPTAPPHAVMAGETWNFQAWFRDSNPTQTSNFTDGVSIMFD